MENPFKWRHLCAGGGGAVDGLLVCGMEVGPAGTVVLVFVVLDWI